MDHDSTPQNLDSGRNLSLELSALIELMYDHEAATQYVEEQYGKLDPIPTQYFDLAVRVAAVLLGSPAADNAQRDLCTYLSNAESAAQVSARFRTVMVVADSLCRERNFTDEVTLLADALKTYRIDILVHFNTEASDDEFDESSLEGFRTGLMEKGLAPMGV